MSVNDSKLTEKSLVEFSQMISKLKRTLRTGWINSKVKDPESVAEHSFRLAILTMVCSSYFQVDQLKSIKMALVHDVGEAKIGDIVVTHGDQIIEDQSTKIGKERIAFSEIFSLINDTEEYINLFDEFEEQRTREAQLVKQLDKLEMLLQALEYEKEQKIDLEPFFLNVRNALKNSDFSSIVTYIESIRSK